MRAPFAQPPKIRKIINRVYKLEFNDRYNMSMHFLRYSEYYESSNRRFRGHPFSLLEFMEWYSRFGPRHMGSFTYPIDWGGYNIPGTVIMELSHTIPDVNQYDKNMLDVCNKLKFIHGNDPFYLIAGIDRAMDHEVAHGLYFTNIEYREGMDRLVRATPAAAKKAMYGFLKKVGYASTVYRDEMQAYMSTGLPKDLKKSQKLIGLRAPFIKLYKSFRD